MIWLDLLAVGIVVGAVLAESKRQFGATLFDMIAVLGSVKLARLAGPLLAHQLTVLRAPDDNQALAIVVMLVVAGGVLLVLAKLVQDYVPLTLEGFDSAVGAICGFAAGTAAAHIVLVAILAANPATTDWGAAARRHPLVRQVVYFDGYHHAMRWLRHAGEPEQKP